MCIIHLFFNNFLSAGDRFGERWEVMTLPQAGAGPDGTTFAHYSTREAERRFRCGIRGSSAWGAAARVRDRDFVSTGRFWTEAQDRDSVDDGRRKAPCIDPFGPIDSSGVRARYLNPATCGRVFSLASGWRSAPRPGGRVRRQGHLIHHRAGWRGPAIEVAIVGGDQLRRTPGIVFTELLPGGIAGQAGADNDNRIHGFVPRQSRSGHTPRFIALPASSAGHWTILRAATRAHSPWLAHHGASVQMHAADATRRVLC
jgi:hypothetical protein